MSYKLISGIVPQLRKRAGGASASGYYLKAYEAGTTTSLSMGIDQVPSATLAKCKLNTLGEPISNDSDETSVFIPAFNAAYKLALYRNSTDADNNTTANALWVVDDIDIGTDITALDIPLTIDGVDTNVSDYLVSSADSEQIPSLSSSYASLMESTGQIILDTNTNSAVRIYSLANYRTLIADPAWTPDGSRNYMVGASYVAIKQVLNNQVSKRVPYALPSEFSSFKVDPQIIYNGSKYVSALDPRSLKPTYATTLYVDPIKGNDTTGDGSEALPYQTLYEAVQTTTDKNVILKAGEYPYLLGPQGRIEPQNINLVCPNGRALFTNEILPRDWRHISAAPTALRYDETIAVANAPEINGADWIVDRTTGTTWFFTNLSDGGTPVPATAKISSLDSSGIMVTDGSLNCTLINADAIYYVATVYGDEDLNAVANDLRCTLLRSTSRTAGGDQLSFASTLEGVVENEHTWRTDPAISIIHLPLGMSPVGRVSIRYALENLAIIDQDGSFGDMSVYVENVDTFYGAPSSIRVFTGTSNSQFICVNCNFSSGQSSNTLELYGNGFALMWGCTAHGAFKDGFNYHVNTTNTGLTDLDIIEVNCKAHQNGRGSTETNNGSTAHETARIIRINGDYSDNQNRNIQDINDVKSLNVGIVSRFGEDTGKYDVVMGRDGALYDEVVCYLIQCEIGKARYELGTLAYVTDDSVISEELEAAGSTRIEYFTDMAT